MTAKEPKTPSWNSLNSPSSLPRDALVTLCPMDCSPPVSSVHGILQAGVGFHALLQGIFLTQGLNLHFLCLLHWQLGSLPLAPPGMLNTIYIIQYNIYGKKSESVKAQSCLTCDPMNYRPPGSSVHRILQAKYWNE